MLRPAEQAEIVRSNQKDEFYLNYLRGGYGEVIHTWLGPRLWMKWRKELDLFADITYFALTTLGGYQTLGEEYVNVIQVDQTHRAIPSSMRRAFMIGLQAIGPYAMEKILVHIEKQLNENPTLNINPKARETILKAIPIIRHTIMLLHRCHLAAFYLNGVFYHIAKRISGVHYLRVVKRDGGSSFIYRVLGWLSLIQLSITLGIQIYSHYKVNQTHAQSKCSSYSHSQQKEDKSGAISSHPSHRCALCLETRTESTATTCGHLFCWTCIHEWCAAKAECPLCRQTCESSRLVFLQNYDYR